MIKSTYQDKINEKFGQDLQIIIRKVKYTLVEMYNKEMKRYMKLYNHIISADLDKSIKQMLYEKLQDEYDKIMDIQKNICLMLKLADNTSLDIIIKFLDILNNVFDRYNVMESLIKNIFNELQNIHKLQSEIDINYTYPIFNLSDDECDNISDKCSYIQQSVGGSNCDIVNMQPNKTQYSRCGDSCLRPGELIIQM